MANERLGLAGASTGFGVAGLGLLTQMYMATGGNAKVGGYAGGIAGLLGLGSGVMNTVNSFRGMNNANQPDAKMNGIWGGVNGAVGVLGSVSSLLSTGISLFGDGSDRAKSASNWLKGIGSGLGVLSGISGMIKSGVNYHRQKKALRAEKENSLPEEQKAQLDGLSGRAKKKKLDEMISEDKELAPKQAMAKKGFRMAQIGGGISILSQGSNLAGIGATQGSTRQSLSSFGGMIGSVGGAYMASQGLKGAMAQEKQASARRKEEKKLEEERKAEEEIKRKEEERRANQIEVSAVIENDDVPSEIEIFDEEEKPLN